MIAIICGDITLIQNWTNMNFVFLMDVQRQHWRSIGEWSGEISISQSIAKRLETFIPQALIRFLEFDGYADGKGMLKSTCGIKV